jgi:hypothetical protein
MRKMLKSVQLFFLILVIYQISALISFHPVHPVQGSSTRESVSSKVMDKTDRANKNGSKPLGKFSDVRPALKTTIAQLQTTLSEEEKEA